MIKINCSSKDLSNFFSYYDFAFQNQNPNLQQIYASNIQDLDFDGINFCLSILCEDYTTDLESHISYMTEKKQQYLEKDLLELMKQLIISLEFLAKKGFCYGRINPKTIYFTEKELTDQDSKEKLVENDSSTSNSKKSSTPSFNAKFTIPLLEDPLKWTFSNENIIYENLKKNEIYLSPLLYYIIDKKNYSRGHNSQKSDIYSLGLCMLYASCLNTRPIYEIKAIKNDHETIKNLVQKYLKMKYSNQYIEILLGMLSPEEKFRWSLSKILECIDKIKEKS